MTEQPGPSQNPYGQPVPSGQDNPYGQPPSAGERPDGPPDSEHPPRDYPGR